MASEPHVELEGVGVCFRLYLEKAHTLKETLVNALHGRNHYRDLWALREVSFSVSPGESVGIIGRNGSGKSTLLKVISGVYEPNEGKRVVRATVAALTELGAGFNGELTGRENIFLGGALMGLGRAEMRKRYDRIVDFAEVGEFMDTPVKNYSSGMYARLAFALATDTNADILLVDEILGVGDEAFQRKSHARIQDHLANSGTLVFVSHSAPAVERLCKRAILLDHGRVAHDGPVAETIGKYHALLTATPSLAAG